jgi:hypothetical protein
LVELPQCAVAKDPPLTLKGSALVSLLLPPLAKRIFVRVQPV